MQSKKTFWTGERMEVATKCESKNCRLFFEVLGETFFVIRKNTDGSVHHDRQTELFKNKSINKINEFIKTL